MAITISDEMSPATTIRHRQKLEMEGAVARGASAVLVNCTPSADTLSFIRALTDPHSALDVPVGAYANAGRPDEGFGWSASDEAPAKYARCAAEWLEAGAKILGSCCGTGPPHIHAIRQLIEDSQAHDSAR